MTSDDMIRLPYSDLAEYDLYLECIFKVRKHEFKTEIEICFLTFVLVLNSY